MGIITSVITFKGRVGNMIAYERNGKTCLRAMPETVRQTANTRRSAKWFGAASRKGALIRSALAPDLDIPGDGDAVNRLNSTIVTAGRNNHAALKGFRFNGHTGIEKFFPELPVFPQEGKLHIPAQKLQSYGDAVRMEVKLIATRIDFTTRTVTGMDADVLHIDLEQPFSGADLSVNVPGKGTLLVTLQVRTFLKNGVSNDRRFNAADIIAVEEVVTPEAIAPKSHSGKPQPRISVANTITTSGQDPVPRE